MRTITFEAVKSFGDRVGKCSACGKRVRRTKTFEHTINPWNKNDRGEPKIYAEVLADVGAERDEWLLTPLLCKKCEDKK